MRAGDKVVVSFLAANRDPAVYDRPDEFDIRRAPNPHLVFGHGPHFCLGAHLARTQMRALFAELLRRTSWLEAAGAPSYLRSNFQRGVKRLPLRWTALTRPSPNLDRMDESPRSPIRRWASCAPARRPTTGS